MSHKSSSIHHPLFVAVPNSDGTVTKWMLTGGYGPGNQRFWWPGYQPNLEYSRSPSQKW